MSISIPNQPAPNKAALLGLGLLLPAVISLGYSLTTSSAIPGVAGPSRPALAFEQYVLNLGEPTPRAIHEAQFHFENHSSRTVKITEIKPSCGCLTPKIVTIDKQRRPVEKKEFAPGEHGVLAMGIRPAKETPGEKTYSVVVSYDDGQPRSETLEFRITLPNKKLTVEPNELYFYQVSGESDSRTVMISDFRETPTQITEVTTLVNGSKEGARPLDGVVATLGTAAPGPDGEMTWPVQVDVAPQLPAGKNTGWLVIKTTDPENPQVKVPILLYGQEQSTTGQSPKKAEFYGPVQQASGKDPDPFK